MGTVILQLGRKISLIIFIWFFLNLFLFNNEISTIAGNLFQTPADKNKEMKELGIFLGNEVKIDNEELRNIDFRKLKNKVNEFLGEKDFKITLTNIEMEGNQRNIEVKVKLSDSTRYITLVPDLNYEVVRFTDENAISSNLSLPVIAHEIAKETAFNFVIKHFKPFNSYNMILDEDKYFNRGSLREYRFVWNAVDGEIKLPIFVAVAVDAISGKIISYTCGYTGEKFKKLTPRISTKKALEILEKKYPGNEIKDYNITLMIGIDHKSKVQENILKYSIEYKFNVPQDKCFYEKGKWIHHGGRIEINAESGEIITEGIY
ncbi:hypothetical protein cpu_07700 [Carboxydothermus pertinax]|uniref:Uncharacterized protein n=1 Tax=Carboxydothermus pertinax TaxID=870242 RepID=A0A1L8CTK1_9THEO|nr:hypothetical protein cpu_07700 [Carboxydothermus pertinax]